MSRLGFVRTALAIGIAIVLVVEAALTVTLTSLGSTLSAQLRERAAIATRYGELESTLYRERVAERSYVIAPAPHFATAMNAAARDFTLRSAALRVRVSPAHAAELDTVDAAHARYARESTALLAEIERGERGTALRAREARVARAYERASADLLAARASFAARTRSLDAAQLARAARMRSAAIDVAIVGALLATLLLALLEHYKRRGDEAIALRIASLELSLRTDPLTGLGNARAFADALARPAPTTLLLVDIDDFKAANDARGGAAGDALLRELAATLQHRCTGASLFRLHADRFAVLRTGDDARASSPYDPTIVTTCAQALGGLGVSAGYAERRTSDEEDDLAERAEAALLAAKHEGGRRLVRYDEVRERASVYSKSHARAVRRLLDERAVTMHFQPIVETATGRIIAYEALARPPARFGLRNTQEFFDIAERLHRSFEADRLCISTALREAARRKPNAPLFLNAAPASLEAERFDVERCVGDIRAVGLDPREIVIELTERKIVNSSLLASRIAQIREWGMRVALDDTGAGHAGLDVLSAMSFDFVKIDRSLIVRAMGDERARNVLLGLISIARNAGSVVIAEGIETPDMHAFARSLRASLHDGSVSACQGFALAHPQPGFATHVTLP